MTLLNSMPHIYCQVKNKKGRNNAFIYFFELSISISLWSHTINIGTFRHCKNMFMFVLMNLKLDQFQLFHFRNVFNDYQVSPFNF